MATIAKSGTNEVGSVKKERLVQMNLRNLIIALVGAIGACLLFLYWLALKTLDLP